MLFNKRKVLLINKKFQLSVIAICTVWAVITTLIFYIGMLLMFKQFAQEGALMGLPPEHIFFEFINDQVNMLHVFFAALTVFVILVFFVGGMFLSNKIAGPIYRMTKHMEEIMETGQWRRLKFRDGDYFIEVADMFNKFIESDAGKVGAPPPPPKTGTDSK